MSHTEAPETPPTQAVSIEPAPSSRPQKILAMVSRALSSHSHIIFLGCLGVYLVPLTVLGVNATAKAELIGGNYTNVTPDLLACVAAGLTVRLARRDRKRAAEFQELFHELHGGRKQQGIERAIAAAERAEIAAANSSRRSD